MLFQSLFFYSLLFIFLLPLLISGIIITRKTSSIERFELLFPVGSIFGILLFTFCLNITAFFVKGSGGTILSYLILIFLSIILYFKKNLSKVVFPRNKHLFLFISAWILWGVFIVWKSNFALIGSDTNLYYAVAHSFIKGNFPPLTPWQPDIPLSYHLGASELLGAFHFLTGLNFQFLHLFFSSLFIFCSSQIIIWLIKRYQDLISFLLANLAVAVTFISFGFFYLTWPIFPLHLPEFNNFNQAVLWLRELPTVNQSIEVYGAPINLDGLIYFIFHAFGLAAFLSLMALLIYVKKGTLSSWLTLCLGLSALALINEAIFIAAFPALVIGLFLIEYKERTLFNNLKRILIILVLTIITVFYQGGIISTAFNPSLNVESSAVVLPKKGAIKDDFVNYHKDQEASKLLPIKSQWLPLGWFHVGIDLLLLICLLIVLTLKIEFRQSILLKILFIAAFFSLSAYHFIVPKFLVANGNRFLSTSFLLFSLLISFTLIIVWERINKNFIKFLFLILTIWILIPTILPPLALLSKTRFGENKLIPKNLESSPAIDWLKNNTNFSKRVMVLDRNAPHPSGQVRALVEAGIFAPIFPGNFRAFTIEASPEYFDIAYYLSPKALKKLKIEILYLDSQFYATLPILKKEQLNDKKYFEPLFIKEYPDKNWERVLKIKPEYFKEEELSGTLAELEEKSLMGDIYINNEENFSPSYLRRAIIFSLRNRNLYYLPQSGVYLNVEATINSHEPKPNKKYNFLVLSKTTNPENICECKAKIIWKGMQEEIYLWQIPD